MIGILVECTDHKTIYGVLTAENVSAYEMQEKICEIKDEFDSDDWEIKDIVDRLPREWKCIYTDNISKLEV